MTVKIRLSSSRNRNARLRRGIRPLWKRFSVLDRPGQEFPESESFPILKKCSPACRGHPDRAPAGDGGIILSKMRFSHTVIGDIALGVKEVLPQKPCFAAVIAFPAPAPHLGQASPRRKGFFRAPSQGRCRPTPRCRACFPSRRQ